MAKIELIPVEGEMEVHFINVPGFEGDVFEMKAPESIGPTDKSRWFKSIQCTWEEQENGNWSGQGWVKGEIDYTIKNLLDGTRYDIETTTNLVDGNWQVYTTLDGETGGAPTTTTIPDALSGSEGTLFIRSAIPQ